MISTVTYQVQGNEPYEGGETLIYFHPASGYEIIDVIIKGLSQDFAAITVDEETGKVGTSQPLTRGDVLQVTYKTLPRYESSLEFDSDDFDSTEFA